MQVKKMENTDDIVHFKQSWYYYVFSDLEINKTYLRTSKLLKISFISIFAPGSEVTSFLFHYCYGTNAWDTERCDLGQVILWAGKWEDYVLPLLALED